MTDINYINIDEIPGRKDNLRLPWDIIEAIPKGKALDISPWIVGRSTVNTMSALRNPNGHLRKYLPHLRVSFRKDAVYIRYPMEEEK